MNTDQHVARLEALLARIRRNAVAPRAAARVAPPAEIAEIEEEDLEIEDADVTDSVVPPRAASSPAATASEPALATLSPPAGFESEVEVDVDVDVDVDIEPPQSSARSTGVASTMEEALADFAPPLESQRPKPEGPSAAARALAVKALQLDEAEDLGLSARTHTPTAAEDYAPTVELEEPFDGELELDESPPPSIPDRSLVPGHKLAEPADLDAASQRPPASSLSPPPESSPAAPMTPAPVSEDVALIDVATLPPPASEPRIALNEGPRGMANRRPGHPEPEPVVAVAAPITSEPEPAAPELLSRPQLERSAQPLRYIMATREFRPESFIELLDASLSLGSAKS